MLKSQQGPSPLVRAGLLLFSVAVVGALIGFGWEAHEHEQQEARLEEMLASADRELPGGPQRRSGPSPQERAIIQRATAGMPPYKDAVPQALAADFLDPGSPIAAAWFMTKDTPDQVLGFYRGALLDAGIPIVQHRYNANAGYVGYMVPNEDEMHTVSVLAQGGETAVFVSTGKVASFLESQGQLPPGLSLPPGSREPVVLTFREEGRVRYSVMAELDPEQVNGLPLFFRNLLEPQGWTVDPQASGNGQEPDVAFRRGASRLSATMQREGALPRLYLTLEQPE